MYASVRVEGKVLEVSRGGGGFFPFKVAEASRRKRSFLRLSFQEFRWVVAQMVRFCFSKGEPLWLKSFRWGQRCLLLQLRKNSRGRFIVLSLLGTGGQARSVIFPEGAKAEGWFVVTKMLERLIEGHKKPSPPPRNASNPSRFPVNRDRSFANVVRGELGGPPKSLLKGWRCRNCGSWDVGAAVIGEEHSVSGNVLMQKVSFKENVEDMSVSPCKKSGSKESLEASSPRVNQFQVLRDLVENYLSSDCEGNSRCSSPCASRITESPLYEVEEEVQPVAPSPATSVIVYSRRKKSQKTNFVDIGSGSPTMQEVGGLSLFEEGLHEAHSQGLDGAFLSKASLSGNVSEGSVWVLERMIFFCKKMGLAIEGRETELLSFLASLEANRMKGHQLVEECRGNGDDRDRLVLDGANC